MARHRFTGLTFCKRHEPVVRGSTLMTIPPSSLAASRRKSVPRSPKLTSNWRPAPWRRTCSSGDFSCVSARPSMLTRRRRKPAPEPPSSAIADLINGRHRQPTLRLVITPNFDDLLERELAARGIRSMSIGNGTSVQRPVCVSCIRMASFPAAVNSAGNPLFWPRMSITA